MCFTLLHALFCAHMAVTVFILLLKGYTGKAGVAGCHTDLGMSDIDEWVTFVEMRE